MDSFGVKFAFTKLVVRDIERLATFYKDVCGFKETARLEADPATVKGMMKRLRPDERRDGKHVAEIGLADETGSSSLVLIRYGDTPPAAGAEVELGMMTQDLEGFIARARDAGASLLVAPVQARQLGIEFKVAFLADPEGHIVEVIQYL